MCTHTCTHTHTHTHTCTHTHTLAHTHTHAHTQSLEIHNALLNAADKLRYQLMEEVAGCVSVGTALRTLWSEVPRSEATRQLQVRAHA